jgi:hypothetical protein
MQKLKKYDMIMYNYVNVGVGYNEQNLERKLYCENEVAD